MFRFRIENLHTKCDFWDWISCAVSLVVLVMVSVSDQMVDNLTVLLYPLHLTISHIIGKVIPMHNWLSGKNEYKKKKNAFKENYQKKKAHSKLMTCKTNFILFCTVLILKWNVNGLFYNWTLHLFFRKLELISWHATNLANSVLPTRSSWKTIVQCVIMYSALLYSVHCCTVLHRCTVCTVVQCSLLYSVH